MSPADVLPTSLVGSGSRGVGSIGWLLGLSQAMGVCSEAWSAVPCREGGRTCTASAIMSAELKHEVCGVCCGGVMYE